MGKVSTYQGLIKKVLREWEDYILRAREEGVEIQHVFDDDNGNYLLLEVGWNKDRRVTYTTLHLRLKNGKIWIETDETEEGIATELVKAGVPREDIVLAFQPPSLRHLTDFAVA